MIDPGYPFRKEYAKLVASLEDRIRYGVEQPDQVRFTFNQSIAYYELPRPAVEITRVSGLVTPLDEPQIPVWTVFKQGVHYQFSDNRITWNKSAAEHPKDGAKLDVEFTYLDRPAGLTDFNPGSVIGTLTRAVARELTLLYEQMDEAYRRAFIDQASGAALDNVVALLGYNVARNPAQNATGTVTFFRNSAASKLISIPKGTRIADESGRIYVTTTDGEIPVEASPRLYTPSDLVFTVEDRIAELIGVWPQDGSTPVIANRLPTVDVDTNKEFGINERTIKLKESPTTAEVLVKYKPKSVNIPIKAEQPGPEGNVNALTVVVMPKPPSGIDGVINDELISGGQVAELDDQLRDRAKHALERAGNATLNAIKYAVRDVDGVANVEVLDRSVDATIPLGEVRVRYAGDKVDRNEVLRAIDQTRAAGILVNLDALSTILISGTLYVIPDVNGPDGGDDIFKKTVITAIENLRPGDVLSIRRLTASVFGTPGLADVADVQLQYQRLGKPLGDVRDPFNIERSEMPKPDIANINVVALKSINAKQVGASNVIEVQFRDAADKAIMFQSFSPNVNFTLFANLKNVSGTQIPQQVSEVLLRRLDFSGKTTVTTTFTLSDASTFRPESATEPNPHDHNNVKVMISTLGFPGLPNLEVLINLP